MVVSYCRQTLGQTGDGHFSPIGGYNEKENMVLVLDVARFKYPSYWVSFDLLWDALKPIDKVTGKSRGYVLLSKAERSTTHSFCQLGIHVETWKQVSHAVTKTIPDRLRGVTDVQGFFEGVINGLPTKLDCIVQNRAFLRGCGEPRESDEAMTRYLKGLETLLSKVSMTGLYQVVKRVTKKSKTPYSSMESLPDAFFNRARSLSVECRHIDDYAAFMTLFLFTLCKFQEFRVDVDEGLKKEIETLVDLDGVAVEVQDEVGLLLDQLKAISVSSLEPVSQ
jgi:hypothetical protein